MRAILKQTHLNANSVLDLTQSSIINSCFAMAKRKFSFGVFLASILMLFSSIEVKASLILDIDAGGSLLGAKNVSVNGALYDVAFLDGTCIALLGGCDEKSDFLFGSSIAGFASIALMEKIFVNLPDGDFDDKPQLINGCTFFRVCQVLTPYADSFSPGQTRVLAWQTDNRAVGETSPEVRFRTLLSAGVDTGSLAAITYAVWSNAASASSVPEPGTVILMSLGLAGLSFSRYRRKP